MALAQLQEMDKCLGVPRTLEEICSVRRFGLSTSVESHQNYVIVMIMVIQIGFRRSIGTQNGSGAGHSSRFGIMTAAIY